MKLTARHWRVSTKEDQRGDREQKDCGYRTQAVPAMDITDDGHGVNSCSRKGALVGDEVAQFVSIHGSVITVARNQYPLTHTAECGEEQVPGST